VKLFVYGTLRTGEPQSGLLAGCSRAPASVRGQLYALPAGYPALVVGGSRKVYGELVDGLDEARLSLLDAFEGVDEGLYRRVQVEVDVALQRVLAHAYVMEHPDRVGGVLIEDGRWRRSIRR
jgi:gamma-glutamylcyclotransferase (GGCT)/AIG2-like uncharacterized protein YtfP